ncbi:MAG: DsbA family protein [Acidiphilium sp.]
MPRSIDYVFSMHSPWTYLGHATFHDIAHRHGAAIVYRPVPLGRLFEQTGGLPLPRRHEVRRRYRLVELQRWRAQRNLPLVLQPACLPVDPAPADRLVIGIIATGGDPDRFMRRCFTALWAEERNIGDQTVLAAIAAEAGVAAEASAHAASDEVAARYAANFAESKSQDAFGAPSYVLEGEVFWGQDRLDLLDDALASGRAAYRTASDA